MSGTPCTDCGISNATTWHQHDTGCTVAKALREAEPPERPLVRHGDVLARTYVELGQAFHRLQTLEAFSARVKAAAADAAEWSALRDEVRK